MSSQRHKDNEKRRRVLHASKGLCTRCTRPARPGFRTCEICAAHSRQRVQTEKASRNQGARIRWRHQRRVTRVATEYVAALRKLESVTSTPAHKVPDHPDLMAATRKQVQSAIRQLFAAVEKRA